MDIKPDPYRYVNWILYFLASTINSIPTQAFSGVSPNITGIYEVSEFEANAIGLIFPISYVFLLLPVNYIIDKKGLKISTLICTIICIKARCA